MDLAPAEHELFSGHPSWRSIIGFHTTGLIIAVIGGAIGFVASGAGVGIAIFAVIFLITIFIGFLRRIGTTYKITNRRLYIKRGIVARRTQEANLQRVQNVNTNQSVLQRLLRVGTVDFDTAAGDDYDFSFVGVASPQQVVHAVHSAQRTEMAAESSSPSVPDTR